MRIATTLMMMLLVALPAKASLIAYNLVGEVTQAANNSMYHSPLAVGSVIAIRITVDSSFPADGTLTYPQSDPLQMHSPTIIESATFAGIDADGFFRGVTTTPTSLTFFTGTQMTSFGFALELTGASPGALQAGLLPSTLDPGQFSGGTFEVTQLFNVQNGGFSGVIKLASVPEPATLALLGSVTVGLGLMQRRKKRLVH